MKKIISAFVLLITALFISSCSGNQAPTSPVTAAAPAALECGSISGTIKTVASGWPSDSAPGCGGSGAIVTAFCNGVTKSTTTADANGYYKISNCSPGFYDLQVTIKHYDTDTSLQNIRVTAGADTCNQNLTRTIQWDPGTVGICFNNDISYSRACQIIGSYGCSRVKSYTDNSGCVNCIVSIPDDRTPPEMECIFGKDPCVHSSCRCQHGACLTTTQTPVYTVTYTPTLTGPRKTATAEVSETQAAQTATAIATLWTPTNTPTFTFTYTVTYTPTLTGPQKTATEEAVETQAAQTATAIATLWTPTQTPTNTPGIKATPTPTPKCAPR